MKREIQPESLELLPLREKIENARNSLRDFLAVKPDERVLILKDGATSEEMITLLKQGIEGIGAQYQEILLTKESKREEIQELLSRHGVVIDVSHGSYKASWEVCDEDLEKYNYRLLALYDASPEIFSESGPMSERLEDLEYRLGRMEEILREAAGFGITSRYGTDLEVSLRPFKERRWYKDTGVINQAGQWDNWPGGEIFTTPDEFNIDGTLVLPALDSEIDPRQGVDEFIILEIKHGLITSIKGGKSAERLKKELEGDALRQQQEGKNPLDVYRIGELAFGANAKARGRVISPKKSWKHIGTSTTEAEKRLGSMHLAIGSSQHGEEGTEGFFDTPGHYECVIPRYGLTVEMFTHERDFKNKRNGRKIISDGGINFFS